MGHGAGLVVCRECRAARRVAWVNMVAPGVGVAGGFWRHLGGRTARTSSKKKVL